MSELLPLFANLAGRRVVLIGGGPVAAAKLVQLLAAGADVRVIAPDVHADIEASGVAIERREFVAADLDDAWFVVAAATPEVNREVAAAAESRRVLVNAVDDPPNATAYLGGVIRRDGVTIAISTSGDAPGLAALLRQALDAVLPEELGQWMSEARRLRVGWRRDGVPMAERRPLLLKALNDLYARASTPSDARAESVPSDVPTTAIPAPAVEAGAPPHRHRRRAVGRLGFVSLVGAGPGDADLITRRAAARLRNADLVLFDALVDERLLRFARRAQRFFVGKRAGRHALTQAEINTVMINASRRGRDVVRLKGGDPFVFGRGGEEALALAAARIPFDVVPGVTSALGAPALAGIPVTHRGAAGAFLVVSGHDLAAFDRSVGGITPEGAGGLTLVVLMGVAKRRDLADVLLKKDWRSDLPAALVLEAGTPRQRVWRGTLSDLAAGGGLSLGEDEGPGLLVFGAVAALNLTGDRDERRGEDQVVKETVRRRERR